MAKWNSTNDTDLFVSPVLKNGFSFTTQYTSFFFVYSSFQFQKICSFFSFVRCYLCDYFSCAANNNPRDSWCRRFVCQAHTDPRVEQKTKPPQFFFYSTVHLHNISVFSFKQNHVVHKNGRNEKWPRDVILLLLWNCCDGIISII